MEFQNRQKQGVPPAYTGKIPVAAWINTTEQGDKYITIDLAGMKFNLFKNEPKQQVVKKPEQGNDL